MSLTLADGPLAAHPAPGNHTIDGPAHRLLWTRFPRRVRARFGDRTVLDTVEGRLVHETALLPVLYVPVDDIDMSVLEPSPHRTHCPFKGDATYHTLVAGDRRRENAAWEYAEPLPSASWLAGHLAFYWDALDAWFDEDEPVRGHLRDPFHRVDTRRSSRRVLVTAAGHRLADSHRAVVLSETGLPNRWYVPPEDVDLSLLTPSTTLSVCPYKGQATYWSLRDGSGDDVAFCYPEPEPELIRIRGHFSFWGDAATVEVTPA